MARKHNALNMLLRRKPAAGWQVQRIVGGDLGVKKIDGAVLAPRTGSIGNGSAVLTVVCLRLPL
jgi:hypothetical protein